MASQISNPNFQFSLLCGVKAGTSLRPIQADIIDQTGVVNLTTGTGSGQVSKPFFAALTLTAGAAQTLDMTNLLDEDGAALSFSVIEQLKITGYGKLPGDSGKTIVAGGGTNGLFNELPALVPNERGNTGVAMWSPIVVDATHKIIKLLSAGSGTVVVTVSALGR